MPSYICVKCGYIENSACGGNYWIANMNKYRQSQGREIDKYFKEDYANTELLCSVCTPKTWKDGKVREDDGIHIERHHWSEVGRDAILHAAEASCGNYTNAKEFFESIDKWEGKDGTSKQ